MVKYLLFNKGRTCFDVGIKDERVLNLLHCYSIKEDQVLFFRSTITRCLLVQNGRYFVVLYSIKRFYGRKLNKMLSYTTLSLNKNSLTFICHWKHVHVLCQLLSYMRILMIYWIHEEECANRQIISLDPWK